jgi:MFS superfamily sulfate permease-like transporter
MNTENPHRMQWPRPFEGLRGIKRADLPREISAGITLAALVIPLNIGYAQVAGLPATMGLYAAIIPLVLFAVFTSSRHLVGGPGPATAALVAAALAGFAAPGDPLRLQYALALALMCSLLFFLAWFFRLAFLQNFLSRAVLIGFVSGQADGPSTRTSATPGMARAARLIKLPARALSTPFWAKTLH